MNALADLSGGPWDPSSLEVVINPCFFDEAERGVRLRIEHSEFQAWFSATQDMEGISFGGPELRDACTSMKDFKRYSISSI